MNLYQSRVLLIFSENLHVTLEVFFSPFKVKITLKKLYGHTPNFDKKYIRSKKKIRNLKIGPKMAYLKLF